MYVEVWGVVIGVFECQRKVLCAHVEAFGVVYWGLYLQGTRVNAVQQKGTNKK